MRRLITFDEAYALKRKEGFSIWAALAIATFWVLGHKRVEDFK